MDKHGVIQEDFYSERTRILDTLALDENKHVILRLVGALAFRTHCPEYGYIQDALGRKFTDIDFASYSRFQKDIIRILVGLGYSEDKVVTQLFSDNRLLFHDMDHGRHIDIFFNGLNFCHSVSFKGRLEIEKNTLPLAELLLEKIQIVRINEKDIIDSIMLIREHPVGDTDNETINASIIAHVFSNDWGFWHTGTANLLLIGEMVRNYPNLSTEDCNIVDERIHELLQLIADEPKSLRWKARNLIGERMKWYKDVEELMDRT